MRRRDEQPPINGMRLVGAQHPLVWAKVCYEPEDILEIRAMPPRQLVEQMAPRRFRWAWLQRQQDFHPWVAAGQLETVVNKLRTLNHIDGVDTAWGMCNKETGRWEKTDEDSGVQLNIYVSANPRSHHGGMSKQDVALARCLCADIEHTAPDLSLDIIKKAGLPTPTMTVNSGHGTQTWWRLDEPITDLALWTDLQKRLIRVLQDHGADVDTKVHDPARLMRLPGFENVNGVPALAHIFEAGPNRTYGIEDLRSSLPQAAMPRVQPSPNGNGHHAKSPHPPTQNRAEALKRALGYVGNIGPIDGQGRNNKLFEVSAALVEKFALDLAELRQVAEKYNDRFPQPLDDGEFQQVTENAFRQVGNKDQPRGTLLGNGFPVEPYRETDGPVLSLVECQDKMREARIESLQHPGEIFFDGSTTGAGKTTADQAAMRMVDTTITFLPTHEACHELAETLAKAGLQAAAFPRIDETTCQRFAHHDQPGDAQNAQAAGLDVGVALCPDCPHYRTCRYQQARKEARKVPHAVATHARAAHSVFAPAEGRKVIFLHEDCVNLLRPTIRITAKPTPNGPSIRDLQDVLKVAETAKDIAETMGDTKKMDFAALLYRSTKELIGLLENDELLLAVELAEAHEDAGSVSRVRSVPLKSRSQRPDRFDYVLYRAVRENGIRPNGDAMRLCLGYTCGELETLAEVIDDAFTKATGTTKQHRTFFKSLIAVRRVDLPDDAVVWLEDATGNHSVLSRLVGRPVFDRTPPGRLAWVVPPVQYPDQDVTQQTSPNIVRGLVRGLLAKYGDAQKVGIITHRVHVAAIKDLESHWADRITRIDYFRSGNDRASNKWLDCDLLIILGTPRVPPSAVREGLVQIGMLEDAGGDGQWGVINWQGHVHSNSHSTPMGLIENRPRSLTLPADRGGPGGPPKHLEPTDLLIVEGRGYRSPAWAEVHHHLVRAAMLQAVGRGRGVRDQGVPVIVVSNEYLGLPLIAQEAPVIKDTEARTFMAYLELTVKNPKYNTLGEMTVRTSRLAQQAGMSEEETRRHCTHLQALGVLAKKGQRGGWMLASPNDGQLLT